MYFGNAVLRFSLMGLSLIALNEFYKAMDNGQHKPINYLGYIFTVVYYLTLTTIITPMTLFIIFCFSLFIYLVLNYPKVNINDISITIFGVIYIPILFSYVYKVRQMENGIFFIWLVLITAFATDTFAYFTGVFIGKHKLIPQLSPNKTIEGSIGGILGTIITCIIYTIIVKPYLYVDTTNIILYSAISGFVCSIFAQFGDLTASSIKRLTGVKDFGKLIPGHGGILDRFDSVLFTAPILYIFLTLFIILNK